MTMAEVKMIARNMSARRRGRTRGLILLLAALPLAGCISFGAEPPPSLLTLTPEAVVPVGAPRTVKEADAVLVSVPSMPQALLTVRVPVRTSETEYAYLKEAQWVETPNRLFRSLLAETITARTSRVVPDMRNFSIAADTRLTGRLVNFNMDTRGNEAIVTFDASLLRKGSAAVETRRFEARTPLASDKPPTVAAALNAAANKVATEVADWVG